jgi:hypothetical protein
MLTSGWHLIMVMSVGGLVIGVPAAIGTYFLTKRMVLMYHRKRAARRMKRAALKK